MNAYYQSGHGSGRVKESFFVEDHVEQIVINWLGEEKEMQICVTDPANHEHKNFTVKKYKTDWLAGGILHRKIINDPAPGLWHLAIPSYQGAYMLNIQYQSPINQEHQISTTVTDVIEINYTGKEEYSDLDHTKFDILIEFISPQKRRARRINVERITAGHKVVIPPFADGVYNLTIQLTGKTKNGYTFQRTMFDSVFARKKRQANKFL